MIKTSKLILIRHAPVKTEVGCFPDNDPDAIIDELKIKRLAGYIPEDCLWYVSPLKRTVQTANALSKYVNVKEMKFEKRLKEQNFGDWAGKKISEVWKELKKNTSHHNFSFICPEVFPPKGENFLTILERVSVWLEELHFHEEPQTAVIITHAGIIRGTLSFVLGIEPDKVIGIEISHLSITRLEFLSKTDDINRGGRFRILGINNKVD